MDYVSVRRVCLAAAVGLYLSAPPFSMAAQGPSAEDYARAEKFISYNVAPLVLNATGPARWLPDGRFWYRRTTVGGSEFVLVDPVRHAQTAAFDHAVLAAALSTAAAERVDAARLPFDTFEMSDVAGIIFEAYSQRWSCDLRDARCSKRGPIDSNGAQSPDKRRVAYIRDYNLWVRDVATGEESQLTTVGAKDFGYATDNAGWIHSDRAIVSWSPDSKRIATYQQDQRGVGDMYLVSTRLGHPELESWKYAMPGDEVVPTIQRVIIDVATGNVLRLKMPPDQRRTAHCWDLKCRNGKAADLQWSDDGRRLAFVSMSRDHKQVKVCVADVVSGVVRDVLKEQVASYYHAATGWAEDAENWRFLSASNEIIWFSQRDDWGHLYLYDALSGKLKRQISSGKWNVIALMGVDEKRRTLYVLGAGREVGRDPYFAHLYSLAMDGGAPMLMAPSGDHFVDRYSKPDVPPTTVLRDRQGKLIRVLERADISRLLGTGWRSPVPITMKGRDGKTDAYGLMYKPSNFDAGRKYPIVNSIYPGPQIGSVGPRTFNSGGFLGDEQSLAELGFIVVQIDGMGTSMRSKTFQDTYYGNMGDNTLPDQIAGMQELAQRHAWIDLNRAGIYGISEGGFGAADGMFRYPDFFKVGISMSGVHDIRAYEGDWGEEFTGLLVRNPDGTSNYDSAANTLIARNLKGHLLLMHGTLDDNVPPYLTFLVINALMEANKDFDLLILPNQRHAPVGVAAAYAARRRWDYFVRHLLEAEPPHGFELHPASDDALKSRERANSVAEF
jgi:dipeptidyl aminopeptidase/acylaminoacyl peptidase